MEQPSSYKKPRKWLGDKVAQFNAPWRQNILLLAAMLMCFAGGALYLDETEVASAAAIAVGFAVKELAARD